MSSSFDSYLLALQKELDIFSGVAPDFPLNGLAQWDSLAILMVISHFEHVYKVQVAGSEIRQCKTIRELIKLLETKTKVLKNLYIVGAGGFGREIYAWIKQHPEYNKEWVVAGLLDDDADALKPFGNFATILPLADHKVSNSNVYICGLGLPPVKTKLLAPLLAQNAEFISFIHPSVVLGERVKFGNGVVVCPGATISVDISIGDFSMIGPNTTIGHDGTIGAWCTFCAQCDITGRVKIGDGVFAGSRVSIIPSKKVGSKSTLGAGAVVISDVPESVTVVGNPARIL